MQGFIRTACAVPIVSVGDTKQNTKQIIEKIKEGKEQSADIILFPELSISGYTCGDLFFQLPLLSSVKKALSKISDATAEMEITAIVGAPLLLSGKLYDCGVVLSYGKILGIVPKKYLRNSGGFNEKRHFSSGEELNFSFVNSTELGLKESYEIPVGCDLIFNLSDYVKFGIEIDEDLFASVSNSSVLALLGAEIIFNLSARPELVSMRDVIRDTVAFQSRKGLLGYAFVSAGQSESTTDMVFSGQALIAQNGKILAQNTDVATENNLIITDIDVDKIKAERLSSSSFKDSSALLAKEKSVRRIFAQTLEPRGNGELIKISKTPFIPENKQERNARALNIFKAQVAGLKKRLQVVSGKAVIGISGGLDSTLALLVCVEAVKSLNLPPENVFGITMPCFGTSDRTYKNALSLMKALGITTKEINIKDACLSHFKDIGHDEEKLDLTYENSQARERTQVLMDFSGEVGGIVVGTGDLSELALGWCTYNGDHMSMYSVNSGVPKTLIPYIIESLIDADLFPEANEALKDVIATPISPELLPPDKAGQIAQKTESIIGPYILHDFFLYYILRFGFSPTKVFNLAKIAFKDEFSSETILKYLKNFYKRFFSQQFKRSCVPDGVKIGSVGLSPRGDLVMPSDASSSLWIREVDGLV